MFTIGTFLVGLVLFGVGFLMVWRRRNFYEYFGDLGSFFDLPGSNWLTWEFIGAIVMMVGFLYGLGIFQMFMTKLLRSVIFPTVG